MKLARETDLMLLAAMLMVIALGVTMIYSAASASSAWQRQAIFGLVAVLLSVSLIYIPNKIFYGLAYPLYGLGLFGLVLVLFWGTGEDATRWLKLGPSLRLQPSEFAKLSTIMALARYLSDCGSEKTDRLQTFAVAIGFVLLPMSLIVQQPDLGTSISFGAVIFPMLYWAGMSPFLLLLIVSPLLSVVFSFGPLWEAAAPYEHLVFVAFILIGSISVHFLVAKLWLTLTMFVVNLGAGLATVYLWDDFLRDYQKARIMTFVDPESDRLGAGWNIIQSKIAIGSGGFTGKGFLEGTQTKYEFLPASHTDFIFSVIGEELGFIGTVVVLALFFFLIWRALYIATQVKSRFFGLLAIGLAAMLMFHVFVNIGMTIGVMPVTGLPLPFVSYGGSSLVTNSLAIGLLLHVYTHRHEY
jgi:rod shape determining protein RodA